VARTLLYAKPIFSLCVNELERTYYPYVRYTVAVSNYKSCRWRKYCSWNAYKCANYVPPHPIHDGDVESLLRSRLDRSRKTTGRFRSALLLFNSGNRYSRLGFFPSTNNTLIFDEQRPITFQAPSVLPSARVACPPVRFAVSVYRPFFAYVFRFDDDRREHRETTR